MAGVTLSIIAVFDLHHTGIFSFLPEIGIAFVLFLIGMELDLREIKALGKPIILASLGQIILSALAGFAIAGALGFNATESLFLGLGLSFSSTVVVIKMLLEKRDLTSLYGKLAIGILLLEDLVAIIVLMGISVGSSMFQLGFQNSLPFVTFALKAIGLFFLTFFLSKYVLEKVFDAVAKSVELLFLTALTWCFIFTALAIVSGFSVVIGAFLAGVALASSPYHLQIQGKIKPLRDFFVTLFFVYLGTEAKVGDLLSHPVAILVLTIYAITIKPIIYLAILGMFGFRKHTMFQTSLNLSQVSEFSLVMLLVGFKAGLVSQSALSVMAAVGVLSIVVSSINVANSKRIYAFLMPVIKFFESKKRHFLEIEVSDELENHIVVIGAHRVGEPVINFLKKQKLPFRVVDFNPHTVQTLRDRDIDVVFGDISDPEIIDSLGLDKAKLIISTIITMPDNEMLLEECHRRKVQAKIVVRAADAMHAKALKDLGADYVILPETVSSHFLVSQLKTHWPNVHFSGLE